MEKPKDVLQSEVLSVKSVDPLARNDVSLPGMSVALAGKSVARNDVGLAGMSVALAGKDVALAAKSVVLSGLCQSEVVRNGDLCVKDVALEEKSVALEEKDVALGVVKLQSG